jgi:hypothetical protein
MKSTQAATELAISRDREPAEAGIADSQIADPGITADKSERGGSLCVIDQPRAPGAGPLDSPGDYLRVLHSSGRRGLVTLARGGGEWNQ